jgi:hypothetical protein
MYCGPTTEGNMISCEWLEPPERIQKRKELYDDPIGEDYRINKDKSRIDIN